MNNAEIIQRVVLAEGGSTYTDRPDDKGGPTRWGITLATLRRHRPSATADDVMKLTREDAVAIYTEDFINAPGFNILLDDWLRWAVVDAGANNGPGWAKKFVQRALGVKDDGDWGSQTRAALFAANSRKLAVRVCTMRMRFYSSITRGNLTDADHDGIPDDLEMLNGWTDRCMDILEEIVGTL